MFGWERVAPTCWCPQLFTMNYQVDLSRMDFGCNIGHTHVLGQELCCLAFGCKAGRICTINVCIMIGGKKLLYVCREHLLEAVMATADTKAVPLLLMPHTTQLLSVALTCPNKGHPFIDSVVCVCCQATICQAERTGYLRVPLQIDRVMCFCLLACHLSGLNCGSECMQ